MVVLLMLHEVRAIVMMSILPLQIAKLPRGFTVTSTAEATLSKFLHGFQCAFNELYRHRRPLYLLPLNECGVPKFVCTTVRHLCCHLCSAPGYNPTRVPAL
jgi:hypothetical protein